MEIEITIFLMGARGGLGVGIEFLFITSSQSRLENKNFISFQTFFALRNIKDIANIQPRFSSVDSKK